MKAEMEALQNRQLMSVVASVGAGTLFVYGDDQANAITVQRSDSDVVVKKYAGSNTYSEFYRVNASKVQTIKMFGRGGVDTLTVGKNVKANVYINGGAGADYLQGGGRKSFVYGHDQNDTASDDGAADILVVGGTGDCQLFGQRGNDTLILTRADITVGVAGSDYASGGSGNDKFMAAQDRWGQHKIVGGSGVDTIDFSNFTTAVIAVTDSDFKSGPRDGTKRNFYIRPDVEGVIGTEFDDIIAGGGEGSANNRFFGKGGNDTLEGGSGNDYLDGGDGKDELTDYSVSNDTFTGGAGNDNVIDQGGDDKIYGNGGKDVLDGGAGDDSIYGNAGDDILNGGTGDDLLVGGSGSDGLFARDNGTGFDLIYGGETNGTGGGPTDYAYIDKPKLFGFVTIVDTVFNCNKTFIS